MQLLRLQALQLRLLPLPMHSLATLHPLCHPTIILLQLRITRTSLNHPLQSVVSSRVLPAAVMDNTKAPQATHPTMSKHIHLGTPNTKFNHTLDKRVQSVDIQQRAHLRQEGVISSSKVQLEGLLHQLPQDINLQRASGIVSHPGVAANSQAQAITGVELSLKTQARRSSQLLNCIFN